MKADAVATASSGYGAVDTDDYGRVESVLGAAALAYVLDTENQTEYKTLVIDGIVDQLDLLAIGGDSWAEHVRGSNSLWMAIMALDIVHPDLSPEELRLCEEKIQSKVDKMEPYGGASPGQNGSSRLLEFVQGRAGERRKLL